VNVTCGSAELGRVKPSSLRLLSGLSINACMHKKCGKVIAEPTELIRTIGKS
jgi:hypothetical protein